VRERATAERGVAGRQMRAATGRSQQVHPEGRLRASRRGAVAHLQQWIYNARRPAGVLRLRVGAARIGTRQRRGYSTATTGGRRGIRGRRRDINATATSAQRCLGSARLRIRRVSTILVLLLPCCCSSVCSVEPKTETEETVTEFVGS
jgi:hypothetical protein